MFPSPYRETLVTSLSAILKQGISIKSSTLLQAFATFKTIKEKNPDDFVAGYKTTFHKEHIESKYRSRLSHENYKVFSNDTLFDSVNLFTGLSASNFFRFIIPDIISNPIKAAKILHEKFSDDILLFAHHILRINIICPEFKKYRNHLIDNFSIIAPSKSEYIPICDRISEGFLSFAFIIFFL